MKFWDEFFWAIKIGYDDLSQRHNKWAVLLFAGLALVLYWVFFAFEPFFTLASRTVIRWFAIPLSEEAWEKQPGWSLLQAALPLLLLSLLMLGLWLRYKGRRVKTVILDVPPPHKGLIFMLSRYGIKYDMREEAEQLSTPEHVDALTAVLTQRKNLPASLFATTWGTLWVAAQHHGSALQYCWLICTPGEAGTQNLFDAAEQLVHTAVLRPAERRVRCKRIVLPNAYDIAQIKPEIERIYTTLPPDLDVDDVIADFTGGTAAMTAGMVLATLDRRRKIQYLVQDKPLLENQNGARRYLTAEEIRENRILVMIRTGPELVTDSEET